jgi:hypothetical protein
MRKDIVVILEYMVVDWVDRCPPTEGGTKVILEYMVVD